MAGALISVVRCTILSTLTVSSKQPILINMTVRTAGYDNGHDLLFCVSNFGKLRMRPILLFSLTVNILYNRLRINEEVILVAQLSLFLVVLFALIVPILMARLQVNAVPLQWLRLLLALFWAQVVLILCVPHMTCHFYQIWVSFFCYFCQGWKLILNYWSQDESRKEPGQITPFKIALEAFSV